MFLRSLKFSLFENSIQREEEGTSEEEGNTTKAAREFQTFLFLLALCCIERNY